MGDVVSLPALLFDKVVVVAPDNRKEGETLDKATPSFSSRDVELDVHRFLDVLAIGGYLHHHSGLKAERQTFKQDEGGRKLDCVLMYYPNIS